MPGERLRQFSSHVLNPVVRHWAGSTWSPFALLLHTGRRSGRAYATPILVRSLPEGYVIALTYGPCTDWYRNLLAARGGMLRWRGRDIRIGAPAVLPLADALVAFSPPERAIIHLVGITQFVRVPATSWDRTRDTG